MKKILLFLIFSLPLMLCALEPEKAPDKCNALRVLFNDRTVMDFMFTEAPEFSFSDGDEMFSLKISSLDNEYEFSTGDIDKIIFLAKNTSGIGSKEISDIEFIDGALCFRGLSVPVELCVSDMAGRVFKQLDIQAGSARLDLSELPKGIYIIKFGSRTLKLAIR